MMRSNRSLSGNGLLADSSTISLALTNHCFLSYLGKAYLLKPWNCLHRRRVSCQRFQRFPRINQKIHSNKLQVGVIAYCNESPENWVYLYTKSRLSQEPSLPGLLLPINTPACPSPG